MPQGLSSSCHSSDFLQFLPFFTFLPPPFLYFATYLDDKYLTTIQIHSKCTTKPPLHYEMCLKMKRNPRKEIKKNRPMQHQRTELICWWLFSILCNTSCLLDFHNLCFRMARGASSRPPAGFHKLWERLWNLYNRHRDPMGITICECSVPCSFMN